jgi:hypothetical protein
MLVLLGGLLGGGLLGLGLLLLLEGWDNRGGCVGGRRAAAVGGGFFDADVKAFEFDLAVAGVGDADAIALGVYCYACQKTWLYQSPEVQAKLTIKRHITILKLRCIMNHSQDAIAVLILPDPEILERAHLLLVRKCASDALMDAEGLVGADAEEKSFPHQSALEEIGFYSYV